MTQLDFLEFLRERKWYLYKDGTWYSNYKRDYTKTLRYYSDEELEQEFKNYMHERVKQNP